MLMRRPLVVCAGLWIVGIHFAIQYSAFQAWVMMACLLGMSVLLTYRKKVTLLLALLYGGTLIFSYLYFNWYDAKQVSVLPYPIEAGEAYAHVNAEAGKRMEEERPDSTMIDAQALQGHAEGVIDSPVERDGDRVQFELRTKRWKDSKGTTTNLDGERLLVQIKLKQEKELETIRGWSRGMVVQVQGELERPGSSTNFGAFDYSKYLQYEHMYWLLKGEGALSLTVIGESPRWMPAGVLGLIEAWRQHAASLYDQLLPKEQSTYLQGLVLGMRSDLDVQIEDDFAQLGLTHVLAISGLHVAVFVSACLLVLKAFRLTREMSLTIVIGLVPLYVLFTGGSPSVVRAGMMSILALIGLRQGWVKDGLHLLCGALLAMLLIEPYFALNVSFQLSFIVTAGLIIGVPLIQALWPASWPMWLRSSLSVSITAQLISFPLTIFYFNQVSMLSLFANLIFVPFISGVVLPLGTITLLVAVVWFNGAVPVAWLTKQCNDLTFMLIHSLSRFEQTTMIWASPDLWWIAGYYAALLSMLFSISIIKKKSMLTGLSPDDTVPLDAFQLVRTHHSRKPKLIAAASSMVFVLLLFIGYTKGPPSHTTLSVLDIGQGDSLLLQTKSGQSILIDGGGTINYSRKGEEWKQRRKPYEVGASRIVPLLKKRGIRQLDAVVLTHGDSDHAGGLKAIIEQIGADRLVVNGTWKSSSTLADLYQAALDRSIPIVSWKAGDQWQVDDSAQFTVLYPKEHKQVLVEEEDQNDASLVIMLTLTEGEGRGTILLTGDIGTAQEQEILMMKHEREADDRLDVLKVAHHGSKTSTSTSWIDYWKPRASVISVGRNNRYGHPNEGTLQTLKRANSEVWRTDLHGEIQLSIHPEGLKLRAKHDRMSQ
ncbi:ComEC/Rec2 family competence protein [Paenibacillus sp. 1001270B_150601_E10]|uniref:ComEC/Rec2 family competence protein n=1 Tax=Paenibacillus sp. 1001270B_150601_E10 TaxID=2787079 RepID=UPI00189EE0D7|nr:ComEC/Rec2 family competence protein [Paenibacillus sp. 1001270B_150601_E10]